MFYFDNAATGGRKPDSVLSALSAAVKVCANPTRSGHKLALSCANVTQNCRNALSDFFGGYGCDRVVFTKNCTEALNIAILGVLQQGDHVVTTAMEHNSVLRPLEFLKKKGVIDYDVCPLRGNPENGEANVASEDIRGLIKKNTRLVAVTTASNVTGAIPDIAAIRAVLPPHILLLCDGAQGGGHLDIKMQTLGIDMLSLAGHKGLHGMQGSGALLLSERVSPTPILYGGTGSISLSLDMPEFLPDAYPAIVSLLEGVRYLSAHAKQVQSRLLMLSAYFLNGLRDLGDYKIYSKANSCGIVAFAHPQIPSEQLVSALSVKYDMALRGGLHCAPLMHEALGTLDDGLARASFSHFNSEREIDKLLTALKELNLE